MLRQKLFKKVLLNSCLLFLVPLQHFNYYEQYEAILFCVASSLEFKVVIKIFIFLASWKEIIATIFLFVKLSNLMLFGRQDIRLAVIFIVVCIGKSEVFYYKINFISF